MPGVCPPDKELLQLVEGDLSDNALAVLDRHLASCDTCRARLDAMTSPEGSRDHPQTDIGYGSSALDSLIDRLQTMGGAIGEGGLETSVGSTDSDSPPSSQQTYRPEQLDHYQILEEIGAGASGRLFRAQDSKLDRIVALKVLQEFLHGNAQALSRLEREAKAAAGLSHDHIVRLHEISTSADGSSDGPPYLVLEYVDGESLKEKIERDGALDARQAARISAQIASGLEAAHINNVIHRDVKSSNILIDAETQRAKITDFGLARDSAADSQLTVDGSIAGTPAYMSPEQIVDPSQVDARSDVYSLGVVLYECLTGALPFLGTPRMTLIQAQHVEPRPLRELNDRTPIELEIICLKALAKEPSARYASAKEFSDDLQRYLDNVPILAQPANWMQRMSKWVGRNPRVAALWSSIVVVFALATLLSTASAMRLAANESTVRDAERNARRSAAAASTQRDVALRTLRKLVVDVPKALEQVPADTSEVETLVSRIAVEGLEKIASSEEQSGGGDIHTAMGRFQLGATLWRVGNLDEAETHLQRAQDLLSSLPNDQKATVQWAQVAVQTQWYLSWIDWDLEQEQQAHSHLAKALKIVDQQQSQTKETAPLNLLKAQTLNHMAESSIDSNQPADAKTQLEQAALILNSLRSQSANDALHDDVQFELKMNRQMAREIDRNGRRGAELPSSLTNLTPPENVSELAQFTATVLKQADQSALANDLESEIEELTAARDALKTWVSQANDPQIDAAPDDIAQKRKQWNEVQLRLADLLRNLGYWKQARKNYQQVVGRLADDSTPQQHQPLELLQARVGLAGILEGQDRYEQAAPDLESLYKQLAQRDKGDSRVLRLQADVNQHLAWCLDWETERTRAKKLAADASKIVEQLASDATATKRVDWRRWSEDKQIELSLLLESLEMF